MNFSDVMFYENYLTSDFHSNTVISRRVYLLVKMASKTVISPIILHGRISVRGCQSESLKLNCGVPQGSCLGPLFFTIYTRSLLDVVEDYLTSVHCSADDTQLYVFFSPADVTGHSAAITAIERCI